MTTPKARQAWDALNERQRLYLAAIYDADQEAEADINRQRRDRVRVPPASVWRWVIYSIKAPKALVGDTTIQDAMRAAGQLDPGAGSSLKALQIRGLIEVRDGVKNTILGVLPTVEVRMTTPGRAAARAGRGDPPKVRTPAGLLSEWLWGALAILYRAGDEGVRYNSDRWDLPEGHIQRGPSWNALLRLRNRRDGSFMEEFEITPVKPYDRKWRARATNLGRAHYERHYRCYRELYPTVPAVEPPAVEGAHTGLAAHLVRRPSGLVTGPDWRLLSALAYDDLRGRSRWREHLAEPFVRAKEPVPAHIANIPNGLTLRAAQHIARSSAAVGRLSGDRAGRLVELVRVPNPHARLRQPWEASQPDWMFDELDHWPVVCLTDAGRQHVREHLADYQALYPDIDVSGLAQRIS